jgi:hypothetical protein
MAPLWLALLGITGHVLTAYEKAILAALKGQDASYKTLCKTAVGGNGLIILVREGSPSRAITDVRLGYATCGVCFMVRSSGKSQ